MFSVIIPCHNDTDCLDRSIGSVIAQTRSDWQIILMDDGSTDQCRGVVQGWIDQYPSQIEYQFQTNQGVSAARNAGVQRAQGQYVIFLDADDELCPNAMACYATCLVQHPHAKWMIGSYWLQREKHSKSRVVQIPAGKEQRFRKFLEKGFFVGNVSNMCFASDLFDQFEFPVQLRVGEDVALFTLMFALLDPVTLVQEVARQHRRDASLRTQASYVQLSHLQVVDVVFDDPMLPHSLHKYRDVLEARYARSLARHAFMLGLYDDAVMWSHKALHIRPWLWFDLKLLRRLVTSRYRAASTKSAD